MKLRIRRQHTNNLPLASVDNLSMTPLIERMSSVGLKPRTVNKYIEHVKQVVGALVPFRARTRHCIEYLHPLLILRRFL
jgi:hypothetical protein